MSYKTFVSMNIAVIGAAGDTADFVASYAIAGHEVFIASSKKLHGTGVYTAKVGDNVNICSVEEAAEVADIILIAAPPKDVCEIAYYLGDVRGKVIIDATANVSVANGESINTLNAIRAITGSPYIVKIFSTKGHQQMLKPFLKTDEAQWLLVGDSKKAKEATKILGRDLGINRFNDIGGTEVLPLFNATTRSWMDIARKDIA